MKHANAVQERDRWARKAQELFEAGDLAGAREALRQKHDSATKVYIDDADTHWSLAIENVTYDKRTDTVFIGGDYHNEGNDQSSR